MKYFKILRDNIDKTTNPKLKKASELGIFKNEVWVPELKHKFNKTSIEAFEILEDLVEKMKYDNQKVETIYELVDVIISNGNVKNTFVLSLLNINNLEELKLINDYFNKIFNKIFENKHKSIETKIEIKELEPLILKQQITKQTFADDDDIEVTYSDSDSDSNSNTNENTKPKIKKVQNVNNNLEPTKIIDENSDDEDIQESLKVLPKTVREYMIKNRKIRDKRLFIFKSNNLFEPYSSKCGAVDMRQPIVITDLDIQNMREDSTKLNIKNRAYDAMKNDILKWGSETNNLNNYICPRIWCIKDNIIITPLQLIDNDGKCPICNGLIIDNKAKTIGNSTVLLRKGKSNNYWGDKKIPDDFIEDVKKNRFKKTNSDAQNQQILNSYKEKWKLYLKGTEKLAFPSFFDPKLHPQGLCMICCNANKSKVNKTTKIKVTRNFEKCLLHYVDDFSYDTQDESLLKIGYKLNKILKLNDNVAIINKKNKSIKIKKLNESSSENQTNFTHLNLEFIEGITIVIFDKKEQYFTLYNKNEDGSFKYEIPDKKSEISYVLGSDKFPLPNNKYGVLPKKIDLMLNSFDTNNMINKGEIINKTKLATVNEVTLFKENKLLFNKNYGIWLNKSKTNIGDEYAENANLFFRMGNDQNLNNSFSIIFF